MFSSLNNSEKFSIDKNIIENLKKIDTKFNESINENEKVSSIFSSFGDILSSVIGSLTSPIKILIVLLIIFLLLLFYRKNSSTSTENHENITRIRNNSIFSNNSEVEKNSNFENNFKLENNNIIESNQSNSFFNSGNSFSKVKSEESKNSEPYIIKTL